MTTPLSPSPASRKDYSLIPMMIEHSSTGERAYGIFSRLLKEQITCINGPISDDTTHVVVTQLLYLESQSPSKPINMYLNSPAMLSLQKEDDDDDDDDDEGCLLFFMVVKKDFNVKWNLMNEF
ncbi:hypothetical protein CsSME_00041230 [Camellia sinensis var. sinensis]